MATISLSSTIPSSDVSTISNISMQNKGYGSGIFINRTKTTFNFKSIVGLDGITVSYDDNNIYIAPSTIESAITDVLNVGSGSGIYKEISNNTIYLKSLIAGSGIKLTESANSITIDYNNPTSSNITSASNIGTLGQGIYISTSGNTLNFKNLSSYDNKLSLSTDPNNNIIFILNSSNILLSDLGGSLSTSKISGLSTVATTGSYSDLKNKPDIVTTLDSLSDTSISVPISGQTLKYNGTNWVNSNISSIISIGATGENGISVTGSPIVSTGTFKFSLTTTGVADGTYNYPTLTVDSYGRISSITGNPVPLKDPTVSTGDIIYRSSSGITSLSIGNDNQVLSILNGIPGWADQIGLVSSVAGKTGDIALVLSDISNISVNSLTSNQVLKYDGSNWVNYTPLTSINATGSNGISVTGGPITTSGTFDITLNDTTVKAGSYISPSIIINSQGRITGASENTSIIVNPTNATGDILYRNSSGNITRLDIGSDAQVLTVSSGIPSWDNQIITSVNSLTGNVILSLDNISDVKITSPQDNDYLIYQSGTWANKTINNLTDPTTSVGDILYRTSSGIAKLAIGTPDQVLSVNSTGLPYWRDNSGSDSSSIAELVRYKISSVSDGQTKFTLSSDAYSIFSVLINGYDIDSDSYTYDNNTYVLTYIPYKNGYSIASTDSVTIIYQKITNVTYKLYTRYKIASITNEQTKFTLPISATEIFQMLINGLDTDSYTYDNNTHIATYDPANGGYSILSTDSVTFVYVQS